MEPTEIHIVGFDEKKERQAAKKAVENFNRRVVYCQPQSKWTIWELVYGHDPRSYSTDLNIIRLLYEDKEQHFSSPLKIESDAGHRADIEFSEDIDGGSYPTYYIPNLLYQNVDTFCDITERIFKGNMKKSLKILHKTLHIIKNGPINPFGGDIVFNSYDGVSSEYILVNDIPLFGSLQDIQMNNIFLLAPFLMKNYLAWNTIFSGHQLEKQRLLYYFDSRLGDSRTEEFWLNMFKKINDYNASNPKTIRGF